jgi:AraC family transcriptional regulator
MEIVGMTYAGGLRQAWHTHDEPSLSLVVRGDVVETIAQGSGRAAAGDVIVKPARVPHDDLYGPGGARLYTLLADADLGAYRLIAGGPPAALFLRMIEEWREGAPFGEIAVDLLASLFRDAVRPRRTAALHEIAARAASTSVSVEELARERSMHPVALARAFRREFGCSITAYRRRMRVRRAMELLATGAPLADVALESGFADQSHLCRIFRAETGTTPSHFRRLAV